MKDNNEINIFTKYTSKNINSFKNEKNRILYAILALILLFFIITIPLSLQFNNTILTIVISSISILTIILLFIDRFLQQRNQTECKYEALSMKLPCRECTQIWPHRNEAILDIKKELNHSSNNLFIAGSCLNTLRDVLTDKNIIQKIASLLDENLQYHIKIMLIKESEQNIHTEKGRQEIKANLASGHKIIRRFDTSLRNVIKNEECLKRIEYRTYIKGLIPRHFILNIDQSLYFGSYLSHEEGSHSYLIKTKSELKSNIYNIFIKEIKYLIENSNIIEIEEIK